MKKVIVFLLTVFLAAGLSGCNLKGNILDISETVDDVEQDQVNKFTKNGSLGWTEGKFKLNGEEINLKGNALTVQGLLDLGFEIEGQEIYKIIGAPSIQKFKKNGILLEAAVISYEKCEFSDLKVFLISSKDGMNPEMELDGIGLGSTMEEVLDKFGEPFHKSEQEDSISFSYLAEVNADEMFQYHVELIFENKMVTSMAYTVGDNNIITF